MDGRVEGIFDSESVFSNYVVSRELFAGSMVPGLLLVALYIAYQAVFAALLPHRAPPRRVAVGLPIPLRLRDADRGGRAHHLVHVRRGRALMTTWPVLSLTTFLPLVGVLFIMGLRGEDESSKRNARWIALWATLVTFAVVTTLLIQATTAGALAKRLGLVDDA